MMAGFSWNKAGIAALGGPLTVICTTIDARFNLGLGDAFWAAVVAIVIGGLTYVVPNAASAP